MGEKTYHRQEVDTPKIQVIKLLTIYHKLSTFKVMEELENRSNNMT